MAIIDVDIVDGLNMLYKPNSVEHKALLLVSSDEGQTANIMSFTSWFALPVWPEGWSFSVYVFTAHYTHELINRTGEFTVNVPREEMDDIVKYCGSVSGRDHDKFKELSLTKVASRHVAPPIVGECAVHIECATQRKYPFTMTFPGLDKKDRDMTVFETRILAMRGHDDTPLNVSDSAYQ